MKDIRMYATTLCSEHYWTNSTPGLRYQQNIVPQHICFRWATQFLCYDIFSTTGLTGLNFLRKTFQITVWISSIQYHSSIYYIFQTISALLTCYAFFILLPYDDNITPSKWKWRGFKPVSSCRCHSVLATTVSDHVLQVVKRTRENSVKSTTYNFNTKYVLFVYFSLSLTTDLK